MMRAILWALALLPLPAHAGTWTPPQGCEVFLTVQAKMCRVSNHYRCSADTPGDQWRADFDQEGMFFQSRINFEAEWVESFDVNPLVRQWLKADPKDPARFSELLSEGVDTFAFDLGREDGADSSVRGFDRLTGHSVTIDGVALEETQFDATETGADGSVRQSRGKEYISREMRLFFAGPGETDLGDGQWLPIDGSPLQFIFPGEPGFAATQPLFDCDPLTAEGPVSQPESVWRVSHD